MTTHAPAVPEHPSRPAWVRLAVGTIVGVAAGVLVPATVGPTLRLIAGWDAAALTMAGLAWWFIARVPATTTRAWAASEDPGRRFVGATATITSFFSLLATGFALRGARTCAADNRPFFLALGLVGVAAAWALTHTTYTLRYAHLYYRDGVEREGGLDFPGNDHPAYIDFAYYAFTIGMCFQVSDVTIKSPALRRATLFHALLSFVYNTVILAIALNFAIGTL
jgi:uncharacterized membrane protein